MTPIDLEAAKTEHWDVIIAGTSFAAMFFALGLPPSTRVLFVEKGERHTHPERIAKSGQFGAETIRQRNTSGAEKKWVAHTTFGGNSNCWAGCTPRFHPNDFRLKSRRGVGQDWPITYRELEPYYCEVEELMQISGGGSDHVLPRSKPFPFPPHRPAKSDVALRKHSELWFAQPTARSNGGRRNQCCGNGRCQICPMDAKFTIINSLDQFERPEFRYLLGAEVRRVVVGNGVASGVEIRVGGRDLEIRSDLVALGANALFNAAILLRSGFNNAAIGRGLHEQAARIAIIDTPLENYHGGTAITGHNYNFYMGEHRRYHAAVLIENWNAPPAPRLEPGKWTQRLMFKLIAEDLPQDHNRVILEGDEPMIEWFGHHEYAAEGLERAIERLHEIIPTPIEAMNVSGIVPTEAHIQGTHRMGATAMEGAIDRNMRTFEASNVLALGAGAYPTSSPANPTLTLSALSLRAARSLQ